MTVSLYKKGRKLGGNAAASLQGMSLLKEQWEVFRKVFHGRADRPVRGLQRSMKNNTSSYK